MIARIVKNELRERLRALQSTTVDRRVFSYLRSVFDAQNDSHEFFWTVELKLSLSQLAGYSLSSAESFESFDFRSDQYGVTACRDAEVFLRAVYRRVKILAGFSFEKYVFFVLLLCVNIIFV